MKMIDVLNFSQRINAISSFKDFPFDMPFRVITLNDVGTDGIITRFDVKIGTEQYTTGFYSSLPILSKDQEGKRVGYGTTELVTPNKSVDGCINVKANKQEILRALKELVKDIEDSENGQPAQKD